jgi:hypothetical protein
MRVYALSAGGVSRITVRMTNFGIQLLRFDVGHSDSGICKIISPLFCFLLAHIWEVKFNTPKARDILIL